MAYSLLFIIIIFLMLLFSFACFYSCDVLLLFCSALLSTLYCISCMKGAIEIKIIIIISFLILTL